jgi:hypothetical protein
VLAARNGDITEGILPRLISIENLEETRIAALEKPINMQMRRKEDHDLIPWLHSTPIQKAAVAPEMTAN